MLVAYAICLRFNYFRDFKLNILLFEELKSFDFIDETTYRTNKYLEKYDLRKFKLKQIKSRLPKLYNTYLKGKYAQKLQDQQKTFVLIPNLKIIGKLNIKQSLQARKYVIQSNNARNQICKEIILQTFNLSTFNLSADISLKKDRLTNTVENHSLFCYGQQISRTRKFLRIMVEYLDKIDKAE